MKELTAGLYWARRLKDDWGETAPWYIVCIEGMSPFFSVYVIAGFDTRYNEWKRGAARMDFTFKPNEWEFGARIEDPNEQGGSQ